MRIWLGDLKNYQVFHIKIEFGGDTFFADPEKSSRFWIVTQYNLRAHTIFLRLKGDFEFNQDLSEKKVWLHHQIYGCTAKFMVVVFKECVNTK